MAKPQEKYAKAEALHKTFTAQTPAQQTANKAQHKAAMHALWDEFNALGTKPMNVSKNFNSLINVVNDL